jgi:anti-sigma regulatory factor (Ser/Thr protein kinase)
MAASAHEERVPIETRLDVHTAQRRARAFAAAMGFDTKSCWAVAIAASEAATNILKHGVRGEIILRRSVADPGRLELEARDEGPGIAEREAALRDHVSRGVDLKTAELPAARTGLGLGLGAIGRMMDGLELDETPQGGLLLRAFKRGGP